MYQRQQISTSRFVKGEPRCSPPNRMTRTIISRKEGNPVGPGVTIAENDMIVATGVAEKGSTAEWSGMPSDAESRNGRTWVRRPSLDELTVPPAASALTVTLPKRRFIVQGDISGGFVVRVNGKIVARNLDAIEAREISEVLRERGRKPTVSVGV